MVETIRSLREASSMRWQAIELSQGTQVRHAVPSIGGRLMGIVLDIDDLCFVNPVGRALLAGSAPNHPLEVFNAPALPCFEIESHSAAITLPTGERTAFSVEESVQRLIPVNEEGAHT